MIDIAARRIRSLPVRHLFAVGLIVLSIITWAEVLVLGAKVPRLELFLAVIPLSIGISAAFGWWAGMGVAIAAGLLGRYVILQPAFSFAVSDLSDGLYSMFIAGCAVLFCLAASKDISSPHK